jgi:hypothetical protein
MLSVALYKILFFNLRNNCYCSWWLLTFKIYKSMDSHTTCFCGLQYAIRYQKNSKICEGYVFIVQKPP